MAEWTDFTATTSSASFFSSGFQLDTEHAVEGKAAIVTFDHRGRPHCFDKQPSVKHPDGHTEWHWHGVMISERVICNPETIHISDIEAERNSEVQRVLIELYGQQRYLEDCNAKRICGDSFGELYEKRRGRHVTPIRFVKVKNSTPEPDGSIKHYFLRVPPSVRTPQEGLAWTFGLEKDQYTPEVET